MGMSTPASDIRDSATETGALPGARAANTDYSAESGSGDASGRGTVPFRLKPGPILVVVLLALGFRFLPPLVVDVVSDHVRLPVHGARLPFYYADHLIMVLAAIGLIELARRRSRIDYGLHMPHGRSYVATAIVLG